MFTASTPLVVFIAIALIFIAFICLVAIYFVVINKEAISPIEATAKKFAIKAHKSVHQKYSGKPYSYHLKMVRYYAFKYKHLIPENNLPLVLAGCWVHDCIEDARITYNDILKVLGKDIAEIAYALTNDKGSTRIERAGENYYKGINETTYAGFIKICDRLANIKHGYDNKSSMLEKYRKEHHNFKEKLYFEPYKPMFDELEQLLEINND